MNKRKNRQKSNLSKRVRIHETRFDGGTGVVEEAVYVATAAGQGARQAALTEAVLREVQGNSLMFTAKFC